MVLMPFLPQDRIGDRRRVDPVQPDGLPRCRDPPGEADSDGNAYALANLVLDATRCSRHQPFRPPLKEEYRCCIDRDDVAHACQQLVEQVVEVERRKFGVSQRLQVCEAAIVRTSPRA